ncbi:MAG: helix-turn-helix domain-containing protein [Chitinivibrionales bacterium]|nr:helix-turn-helix domain-containing protein [Chitinivibrionales bacterium]
MNASFQICPLDDEGVWDGPIQNYPLHRHEYQEVIILLSGQALHCIDGEKLTIKAPAVFLIAEGKVHLFITSDKSVGWLIRFANEYLPLDVTSLFSQFTAISTISLENSSLSHQVVCLSELLFEVAEQQDPMKQQVLRHLLAALLQILKSEHERLATSDERVKPADYQMFYRFLKQLDDSFKTEKRVETYAHNLNITSRKLALICKSIFNTTPSKLIELRCVIEAKRLLLYSGDNVRQIAFALGYEDHSYFTKIFHKTTGQTPSEFRNHTLQA